MTNDIDPIYEARADFRRRVARARVYIHQGLKCTAAFDSYFEAPDAELVVASLVRGALNNPSTRVAQNIWNYIRKKEGAAIARKYQDYTPQQLTKMAAVALTENGNRLMSADNFLKKTRPMSPHYNRGQDGGHESEQQAA